MKIAFFTIAGDPINLGYAKAMEHSLKHFHPEIPLFIFGDKEVKESNDPHIFYRATPVFGKILLEKYDLVIKIDADSIVTGNLDHIFTNDYDIGTVLNFNRVDQPKYNFPLTVWDIPITDYMNCGFVAMRSKKFVDQWLKLCYSNHFDHYRFREQDLLNIMYHYGDYNVKCFDFSNRWHGLISKGEWLNLKLKGDALVLPVVDNYPNQEKTIKVIHIAGGAVADKMNLRVQFKDEIRKHLEGLIYGKK